MRPISFVCTVPVFTVLALTLLASQASGAIYRCEADHQTVFSDSPCGEDAVPVAVDPVRTGGRLDTGTGFRHESGSPGKARSPSGSGCDAGYIQSTELRRLRVKQQVRAGMSAQQVRYVLGAPARRAGQWWVYERRGEETGRYLIRAGCLVKWR